MKKPPEDRPELLISLTYLPQAERLTFNIMKAKNLNTHHEPWVRVSGFFCIKLNYNVGKAIEKS